MKTTKAKKIVISVAVSLLTVSAVLADPDRSPAPSGNEQAEVLVGSESAVTVPGKDFEPDVYQGETGTIIDYGGMDGGMDGGDTSIEWDMEGFDSPATDMEMEMDMD